MLITYLLDSLDTAGSNLKVQEKGKKLQVKDLEAARHIKAELQLPQVPAGQGRISLNLDVDTSRYWQAFRVPPPGIDFEFTEYPGDLFLGYFGIAISQDQIYSVEEWQAVDLHTVSLANAAIDIGLQGLDPAAAFIEWDNGKVTLECWEKKRVRNDIVSDAEVGFLTVDDLSEPDDIVLMGRSRILPDDEQSAPVMFHQTPVWRQLNDTVGVSLTSGMHPNLVLDIQSTHPAESCILYAHLKMPSAVFVDQYQLQDLVDMTPPSELLGVWGSTDLEAPLWLVHEGSEALVRLDEVANHSIPLHLRYEIPDYLAPRWLPAPRVFWACPDVVRNEAWGIETFFPEGTSFYPLRTNGVAFTIPTIDTASQPTVEKITGLVVILGTLFVLLGLFKRTRTRAKKAKDQ